MSQVDGGDDDGRTADAGEYVLGTLSAEERTRLEARTADDPELRALVGWYRDALIGLDPPRAKTRRATFGLVSVPQSIDRRQPRAVRRPRW